MSGAASVIPEPSATALLTTGVLALAALADGLAHEVLGPERVMFAVDHPFEENEEAVQAMDAVPFSNEDRTRIYQTNAERVFKLGAAGEGGLAHLVAWREHVSAVREWPIDTPTAARFVLFLALPLGSWLGAAMVERLVDSLLK